MCCDFLKNTFSFAMKFMTSLMTPNKYVVFGGKKFLQVLLQLLAVRSYSNFVDDILKTDKDVAGFRYAIMN